MTSDTLVAKASPPELREREENGGMWMDLKKIYSLGGHWSHLEIGELLIYGIDPVPTREIIQEDKRTKYFIKEYLITPNLKYTLCL